KNLFVREIAFDLERADIAIGHAYIFRLTARKAAEQVRIAEQAGRRMSHHFRRPLGVRIGFIAEGEKGSLTEIALATGNGERNNNAVADIQPGNGRAFLDDLAHEFMAEDVAFLHSGRQPVIEVKV